VISEDKAVPIIDITGEKSICAGQSITLNCSAANGMAILWSDGTKGNVLTATPSQSGTFSVVVTDPVSGCTAEEAVAIEVKPKTQLDLGKVGTLTCQEKSIQVAGKDYTLPGIYVISDACGDIKFEILQNTVLPEVTLKEECDPRTGLYQLKVTASKFSAYTIAGTPVKDGAWESEKIKGGTPYRFDIEDLTNGCSIQLTGEMACEKEAGHYFIPNIFRPGSTDEDAWFTIYGSTEHLKSIQILQVFDRWGDLVFERKDFASNTAELGWDGKHNGTDLQPGVFIYRASLSLTDGSIKWIDGNVTLIR
jgi:gliding motility-associated-like protein